MCLLSFYPPQVMPAPEALAKGAVLNDDGHGFAVVAGARLIVRRDLNADRLIEEFRRIRGQHRQGSALFHSRLGTHGATGADNCHPFRLGRDRRTVLAHNGILPGLVHPSVGDTRCDTRIAAEDFLPREPFGPLDEPHAQAGLCDWLGPHNKLVVLTVNPRYARHAYLLGEQHGHWEAGVWYSNTDYRGLRFALTRWHRDEQVCPTCSALNSLDPDTGLCDVCACCVRCGEPPEHCGCYPGYLLRGYPPFLEPR